MEIKHKTLKEQLLTFLQSLFRASEFDELTQQKINLNRTNLNACFVPYNTSLYPLSYKNPT